MSHSKHSECQFTITREHLLQVVQECLDVFKCGHLTEAVVNRIGNASSSICSISLNLEPKPPKNGPYR